jgi:hypothetical protein
LSGDRARFAQNAGADCISDYDRQAETHTEDLKQSATAGFFDGLAVGKRSQIATSHAEQPPQKRKARDRGNILQLRALADNQLVKRACERE